MRCIQTAIFLEIEISWSLWRVGSVMTPQRLATIAGACREFALPGLVVVWLVAFGATSFVKTGASPVVSRVAPSLAANAEVAVTRQATGDKPQPVFAASSLATAAELAPAVPLGTSPPELASVNAEVALVDKPASVPASEPATTGDAPVFTKLAAPKATSQTTTSPGKANSRHAPAIVASR